MRWARRTQREGEYGQCKPERPARPPFLVYWLGCVWAYCVLIVLEQML